MFFSYFIPFKCYGLQYAYEYEEKKILIEMFISACC